MAAAPADDELDIDSELVAGNSDKATWRINALAARMLETRRFGHISGHTTGETYKNKLLLFKLSDL